MKHLLAGVDELDEALDAAREGEVVGLVVALVDQPDAHAVVQKAQLAQALREDVVVEVDVREDLEVGQEVDLGAALLGLARDLHRGDEDAAALLDLAVDRHALAELHEVGQAVAPHRQAQPFRKAVDARDADAVQPARDLVAVLVELAAGVQLRERDLGGRALGLVLVVQLDAGRDAAAVVGDRDRVVGVDRDDDVVAKAREGFVDRVVDDLEDEVVQPRAVGGVADVHARALANRLEPFEDLDRAFAVRAVGFCAIAKHGRVDRRGNSRGRHVGVRAGDLGRRFVVLVGRHRSFFGVRFQGQIRIGMTTYLKPA
jgi:hypothetical protein